MERSINIIIVDDSLVFLDTLEYQLRRNKKFNVLARFTSGAELLEFPDLIKCRILLLDIEMPGLDGLAIAKIVNLLYHHIKIIAVSMYQDQCYLEKLIKAGYMGFINKFEIAEKLFPVIDNVLNNKLTFPSDLKI
jgi:DNA-binding NarL/FixJ family response regulator